jgi:aminoglycoside phosphotransferase (APT) family kinase protein
VGVASGQRVDTLSHRDDFWVLRCSPSSGSTTSFVLKLAGPRCEVPINFSRTAAVTRLVREAGVPVAQVMAFDDSYDVGAFRYLVQEQAEGQVWKSFLPTLPPEEVERSYAQLAGVLVALRTIEFHGFGDLGSDGRPTPGLSWERALEQRASATIRDQRRRDSYVELLHREAHLFAADATASMCHDDLHHLNVIGHRSPGGARITAVLDWDKAWAGHHESDLARMALWDDMTHPAFWSAYRSVFHLAEGAEERRPIYQLLWCLEYDATTPRHLADTARLARQLGVHL